MSDFELLYNNCLTYNGLNNSYTSTAQKLLSACQQACQFDFDNQMSHLEEEISNKMMINLDDEHSQSGAFNESNHAGKSTADFQTESEFNLATFNNNEIGNADKIQMSNFSSSQQSSNTSRYSSSTLMPHKKSKSSNKSVFSNNSFDKSLGKSNFQHNNVFGGSGGSNLIKKKKQNPIFSSVIKLNKNSPKSSSDAETYVDVESIDERTGVHSLIGNNNARYTNNKKMTEEEIVCVEDAETNNQESRVYEYNENQFEENY
jgi:hypothetical protein